jgi:hypothetical protein
MNKTSLVTIALYLVISIFACAGWVLNLAKFVQCDFDTPFKTEIVRGTGVVVPVIGAVVGYMDIGEEER